MKFELSVEEMMNANSTDFDLILCCADTKEPNWKQIN